MASTLSLMPVPQGLPSSSSLHTRHWPPIRLLTWTTENLDPTIQDGCPSTIPSASHTVKKQHSTCCLVEWATPALVSKPAKSEAVGQVAAVGLGSSVGNLCGHES